MFVFLYSCLSYCTGKKCPTGYYNTQTASTTCSYCQTGKKERGPVAYTTSLPNGLQRQICDECPSAKYNDQNAQSNCKNCPNGWIQTNTQEISCTFCSAGKYETGNNLLCK